MKAILTSLFNNATLSATEAETIMLDITQGKYSAEQISAFLTVFEMRGIEVDEIIGFRSALLQSRVKVDLSAYNPIDIVGTGGDGKNTFNISTCSCFVLAGAGYKVAKHGNFGATSVSGASTVMQLHGVQFTNDESKLRESIEKCGMAYLHAPLFTPAMKAVAGIRKSLGVKTLFNLMGPLVNPCLPKNQLLGTANLNQLRLYSSVYQRLNTNYMVVSSLDGYDEVSLTSDFKISSNSETRVYSPSELGFKSIQQQDIFGGNTAEEAKQIFDNVLTDQATEAQKNCVLANSAFGIKNLCPQKSIADCVAEAKESIESGRALDVLKKFVEINS